MTRTCSLVPASLSIVYGITFSLIRSYLAATWLIRTILEARQARSAANLRHERTKMFENSRNGRGPFRLFLLTTIALLATRASAAGANMFCFRFYSAHANCVGAMCDHVDSNCGQNCDKQQFRFRLVPSELLSHHPQLRIPCQVYPEANVALWCFCGW